MKILPLSFVGILLVATAATGSADVNSITNPLLFQIAEATTTTTDMSFGAKALEFLTYCNNQFSQTPVSSMTTDILVFCTMVYDWYLMGCNNNNAIVAPIIAAQCNDPVIIQQVINYKTEIDIRIKQIVKIEVSPPGDGGGGSGKLHHLTISISFAKDPIVRGNTQTITVTVTDANTKSPVSGVSVSGTITYASGATTKTFSGTTDGSGKVSFSFPIGGKSTPGIFTVSVQASKAGYQSASSKSSFKVIEAAQPGPICPQGIDSCPPCSIQGNQTGINCVPPPPPPPPPPCDPAKNQTCSPPDPCIENPTAEGCPIPTPPPLPDCEEDPTAEGCEPIPPAPNPCDEDPTAEGCEPIDPCIENPTAEGCEDPEPIPDPGDGGGEGDDGSDGGGDDGSDGGGDDGSDGGGDGGDGDGSGETEVSADDEGDGGE